jgi:hypothetical protein
VTSLANHCKEKEICEAQEVSHDLGRVKILGVDFVRTNFLLSEVISEVISEYLHFNHIDKALVVIMGEELL